MAKVTRAIALACLGVGSAWVGCGNPDGPAPVRPTRAARLEFRVQPASVPLETAIAPGIEVAILDSTGNTVQAGDQTVSIALGTNPGGSTLSGTLAVAASRGIARFTDLQLNRPEHGYTLIASALDLPTATSDTFRVLPAPGTHLVFRVQPVRAVAGMPIAPPIEVAVRDASGHDVAGAQPRVTITLMSNAAGASLLGATTVTASGGIARFPDLALSAVGEGYSLAVSAPDLPSATSGAFSVVRSIGFHAATVAAGMSSTCALDRTGAAWCWGDDVNGELGDGRILSAAAPTPISGALRWSSISLPKVSAANADGGHGGDYDGHESIACALTPAGAAYCWGGGPRPFNGADAAVPQPIAGGLTFASISTGEMHACALTTNGAAWCWGSIIPAIWGDHTATPVGGDLRFKMLATGLVHTCAVTGTGAAYCWGLDAGALLGNGDTKGSGTPVPVSGGLTFSAITVGWYHSCGLLASGEAWCWGSGRSGQLGDGDTTDTTVPVPVSGAPPFVAISAGAGHTCGLTVAGAAWCWGFNSRGQLGNGSTTLASTPVPVAGGHTFNAISGGYTHTCAVTTTGEAWCWGWNGDGQLGSQGNAYATSPVQVSGGLRFQSISAGGDATCGITIDNTGVCWGDNYSGELGDGHPLYSTVPVRVAGGVTFRSLSAAQDFICGVSGDDKAWCWGGDGFGIRGRSSVPVAAGAGFPFSSISAGREHTCGVSPTGNGWCWGYPFLGNGTSETSNSPVQVAGPGYPWETINADYAPCGIGSGGTAYCWGYYVVGKGYAYLPVPVATALKFVRISGGADGIACGLTGTGEAYCWGDNRWGQLGDGTRTSSAAPVAVTGGLRFISISVGSWGTCAVTIDGRAYCWYADKNNTGFSTPTLVPGGLTFTNIDVSKGDGYGGHACGTTSSGAIYCFGTNQRGQLGNGSTFDPYAPPYAFNVFPTLVVGGLIGN